MEKILCDRKFKKKKCLLCGKTFIPKSSRSVYCGSPQKKGSCSYKNWRRLCKKWMLNNKEKNSKFHREWRWKDKLKIMEKYGGRCVCCGEDNPMFLTFDHKNNDGAKHRKTYGGRGVGTNVMRYWIKKNNYPDTIQLLCYNCNCSKGFFGECPHKSLKK